MLLREKLTTALVEVLQSPQALVPLETLLDVDGSHELRRGLRPLHLAVQSLALADDVGMNSPGLAVANDLDVAVCAVLEQPERSSVRH